MRQRYAVVQVAPDEQDGGELGPLDHLGEVLGDVRVAQRHEFQT